MSAPVRLRLRENLDARLIAAVAALVLVALLAANGAALLLLRDQLARQSELSLQQGQRTAALVLAERRYALENLAVVLVQRPTLQRLVQAGDYAALSEFLEDFRRQSDLDWILFCDAAHQLRAASGARPAGDLCQSAPDTDYRLLATRPALVAAGRVGDGDLAPAGQVVAGRWVDAAFLDALVTASRLEQSLVAAADGRRLVSTWPAPSAAVQFAAQAATPWPPGGRIYDRAGDPYDIAYTGVGPGAAPQIWLESALPVAERLAAERRVLALLALSTAIMALVLVGVAVVSARRVSRPLTDALRRSQDAVLAAQAERIAALEALDALIQSIIEGVIMSDAHGIVRFFSAGAEQILGVPAAQATGQPLTQVLTPADGGVFSAADLLATPGRTQLLELRTAHGERITAAIGATPIRRAADEGSLTAYLLRDVTEEEAHNQLRAYFLSSITHEFRTPLSTLRASLELLAGDESLEPAEVRALLRPAYLSIVGLQTLVDNLLTSGAIEAGHFTQRLADVDLATILADAVRVVRPMLERHQQQLIVELPAVRPRVRGDEAQLTQVMLNLLTNAAKYSPPGSPIEVVIGAAPADARAIRVTVVDRGPGVPPTARGEIFRRFVRQHDSTREQYGVGLGLYVAKTTITAHHGRIDVEARPGGGSIFWFELPMPHEEDRTEGP